MITSGPFVSTLLCIFFALIVLLTDSLPLLLPVVESKRSHTSMMITLFGPALGIKDYDRFVGWSLTSCVFLILLGIWQKDESWSLICNTVFATLQPFFVVVAHYTKAFGLPAPFLPVVYSAVFGAVGLLWREVAHEESYFRPSYVPLVTGWHVLASVVALAYVCRVGSRAERLRASLELELLKKDTFRKRECEWSDARETPRYADGFQPYPILVEAAEKEQDQTKYARTSNVLVMIFVLVALYAIGASQIDLYEDLLTEDVVDACLVYATLPLVLVQLLVITIYCLLPNKKRTTMFDDIEGTRSFT